MNEAGGNKEIHEFIQLECPDPVLIQFPALIVDFSPYLVFSSLTRAIISG
jgi:hypothetical protein